MRALLPPDPPRFAPNFVLDRGTSSQTVVDDVFVFRDTVVRPRMRACGLPDDAPLYAWGQSFGGLVMTFAALRAAGVGRSSSAQISPIDDGGDDFAGLITTSPAFFVNKVSAVLRRFVLPMVGRQCKFVHDVATTRTASSNVRSRSAVASQRSHRRFGWSRSSRPRTCRTTPPPSPPTSRTRGTSSECFACASPSASPRYAVIAVAVVAPTLL